MKHKQKATIIATVFVALFIIVVLTMNTADNALRFCSFDDAGDSVCFGSATTSDLASIVAVNSVGKSTFAPNEVVNVRIYVEKPRDIVPPIYTAQVYIEDVTTKQTIKIWDVKSQLIAQPQIASCLGSTTVQTTTSGIFASAGTCKDVSMTGNPQQIMTFNAPSKSGQYTVAYVIRDSKPDTVRGFDNSILIEEKTTINVASVGTTTCPKSTCTAYETTKSISNGVYQQRSCLRYDSACTESRSIEYRTVCSSGYVITGETGSSSTGYKTCSKIVEQQPAQEEPVVQEVVQTPPTVVSEPTNVTISQPSTPDVTQEPKTNAFTQFFIDLWQSIKQFFITTFA